MHLGRNLRWVPLIDFDIDMAQPLPTHIKKMRAKSQLTTSVKTSPKKNCFDISHFVSTSWALEDSSLFLPIQIIICERKDTEKSKKQKQANMCKQQCR